MKNTHKSKVFHFQFRGHSDTNPELVRILLHPEFTKVDFGYSAHEIYKRGGWIRMSPDTFIEVIETNPSKEDLLIEKKKKEEAFRLQNDKKSNFNIPVNPEKYVEKGTKPELHDKGLSAIDFSSNAVLWKKPGKGYSVDTSSKWSMQLNIDRLHILSTNGISKSYSVLQIKYDEDMRMQEFTLGDETGSATHTFEVAWSKSRNGYTVILSSIDNTEEYQFQDVSGVPVFK